jgi:hypothetical protein
VDRISLRGGSVSQSQPGVEVLFFLPGVVQRYSAGEGDD